MALSISSDTSRPGGGFARLEGPGLEGVTALSIENCFSTGQYLGEDGRWGKKAFLFPVEVASNPLGALSLGPHIVDYVPTELQIALRNQDGVEIGKVFWADIIPSRNPKRVTSAQVFEERRRRDAEKAAAETQGRIDAAAALALEATKRETEQEVARQRATREAEEAEAAAAKKVQPPKVATGTTAEAPKRKPFAIVVVLLLLILGSAATALWFLYPRHRGTPVVDVQQPTNPGTVTQTPPQPVDCVAEYDSKLEGVTRLADAEKVAMGEQALRAGCGAAAFRAFDSADPQKSEATAWNMARFYDPNETNPVYRRSGATIHADFAAYYYKQWRDRSARQAAALRELCATADGSASLQRYCAR